MALQALNIVRETLSREIERLDQRMDKMVLQHGRKVDYARFVIHGGFDSTRGHLLGYRDGTWQDHVRAARRYLDSCGPALNDMDDPTWITLPEDDLRMYAEFGRAAARITLLRDSLMARIEKECIDQPDPHMKAVLDGLPDCSDCLDGVCHKIEHRDDRYDPSQPAGNTDIPF